MPWNYEIYPDLNVVITKSSGDVTEDELMTGARTAYADPRFHPDLYALFDYSEVVQWKISTEFVAGMAAKRKFSATSKTAILATGLLNYGMMRVYQQWVDNGQVKIFTNRAEAVAWLNEDVPPEKHVT